MSGKAAKPRSEALREASRRNMPSSPILRNEPENSTQPLHLHQVMAPPQPGVKPNPERRLLVFTNFRKTNPRILIISQRISQLNGITETWPGQVDPNPHPRLQSSLNRHRISRISFFASGSRRRNRLAADRGRCGRRNELRRNP